MTLTMNQAVKVQEDILGIVRDTPEASPEYVFEKLLFRYTGVTLTDVRSVLGELCRAGRVQERNGKYYLIA